MKSSWYVCLFFASAIIVPGCSNHVEEDAISSKEVDSLINRAKQNLVFVDGGEFFLGDVGRGDGRPLNASRDNNKPAIEVKIDSYSISRYETTWGTF